MRSGVEKSTRIRCPARAICCRARLPLDSEGVMTTMGAVGLPAVARTTWIARVRARPSRDGAGRDIYEPMLTAGTRRRGHGFGRSFLGIGPSVQVMPSLSTTDDTCTVWPRR